MLRFGMPTLIETATLEECAALCRDSGLKFIEINMNLPQFQVQTMNPDHLTAVAEEYGISYTIHLDETMNIADFNPYIRQAHIRTVVETIELAKKLRIPVLNMHMPLGVYFTLPERKVYLLGEYPEEYSFIQSLVTDNKALMESDPEYIKRLEALPPKLREAWLNGRWDVFEGAYFEEFRDTPDPQMCHEYGISVEDALAERRFTHVIEPFEIPTDWKIYRSYDWGYGKPFSCAWWAVDYEGIAYRIIELYGCTQTPNEGVKWSNKEQFDKIAEIEREHRWLKGKRIQGVADPSIWDGSHGISAAEEAEKHQLWFEPGVNDRIPGWMQVRERMKFDEDGKAMIYFFNTCKAIIRTMPLMMFDEHKVEDLDTDLEDHACDEVRYFCMMRPIAPRKIETKLKPLYDPLNQFADKYERYDVIRARIGG